LRGDLLPLVFLDEQLRTAIERGPAQDLNIVVLQADDRPFGLVVDAIRDTEEIVVKPLQKQLKGISVFAGAAIMGDGRVALVLDVLGLAQRADVISGTKRRATSESEGSAAPAVNESQSLLCFEPREGGQMAIPLALVARLEEFPRAMLEQVGARRFVQYRGEILPLIDVSHELERLRRGAPRSSGERASLEPIAAGSELFDSSSELIPVVVCAANQQRVGLMVRRILDIVHDELSTRAAAHRPGVLFTAVVRERVSEILDVPTLIREATSELPQLTSV